MNKEQFLKVTTDDVECVYTGRAGCMCGCRGNYRYSSLHATEPGHEVNDRQVKKVLGQVQADYLVSTASPALDDDHAHDDDRVELNDEYAYVEHDGKVKCVYFTKTFIARIQAQSLEAEAAKFAAAV